MKKIFYLFTMLAALTLGCTSCDPTSNTSAGFVYNVNVDGDADGQVGVTFPNGSLDLNGKAGLGFVFSNDTTVALQAANVLTAEEIIASNDAKQLAALAAVNSWVDESFTATATSGTYYVHVQGYVKETLTGFIIAIDRTLTNRK